MQQIGKFQFHMQPWLLETYSGWIQGSFHGAGQSTKTYSVSTVSYLLHTKQILNSTI